MAKFYARYSRNLIKGLSIPKSRAKFLSQSIPAHAPHSLNSQPYTTTTHTTDLPLTQRACTFPTCNGSQDTNRIAPHTLHTTPDHSPPHSPPQLNQPPTHPSPHSPPLRPVRVRLTRLTSISEDQTTIITPPYTTLSPEFPLTPSSHLHPTSPTPNPRKE